VHYNGIAILLVTLFSTLATLAHAQKALPTVLPPEEYDRPFDGILLTHRLNTAAEIRKVYPQGNLGVALGCVWKLREGCLIVMVADEVIRSYKLDPDTVRRHEMGALHWLATQPPRDAGHLGQRGEMI
jgi:hypothetical protein